VRILLALGAMAGVAHADGDRALTLGLGYATFSVPGTMSTNGQPPPPITPDGGGMLDGTYQHGLSDDLYLRAEAVAAVFRGGAQKGQSDTSYALLGDAGFLFRLDVLKYTPYAFAGIGGITTGGGPIAGDSQFVLSIGGGVEFLSPGRTRSWGLEARLASFAGDVTVFTFDYHRAVRWGFF
jgi:hypothetical protein